MARPRCSVFIATSLDGYIARRDGSIDWLDSVQRAGEDYGFREFFATVDTLILGRRTYETALGFAHWPYGGKQCVVMTSADPPPASRHGETFHSGAPLDLIEALGGRGARRVYVDGGATISAFLAARLIDDLTISVIPLLLGAGVRLFADGGPEHPLLLTESRSFDSGLVRLRYAVT